MRTMSRHQPNDHYLSEYWLPEPPTGWHEQDWLLIIDALDRYTWEADLTEGQELRTYQLVEAIARLHGTVSLGALQRLDLDHFNQYARQC